MRYLITAKRIMGTLLQAVQQALNEDSGGIGDITTLSM